MKRGIKNVEWFVGYDLENMRLHTREAIWPRFYKQDIRNHDLWANVYTPNLFASASALSCSVLLCLAPSVSGCLCLSLSVEVGLCLSLIGCLFWLFHVHSSSLTHCASLSLGVSVSFLYSPLHTNPNHCHLLVCILFFSRLSGYVIFLVLDT